MKKNITIVGLAKDFTKSIAKTFADKLDMYYADITDLVQVDILDIAEAERTCGREYVRSLEANKIKTVTSYDNSIITVNYNALNNETNLSYVKENTLLIYLRLTKDELTAKLNQDVDETNLVRLAETVFDERDFILNRICDITINVKNLTDTELVKMISKSILDYYKR